MGWEFLLVSGSQILRQMTQNSMGAGLSVCFWKQKGIVYLQRLKGGEGVPCAQFNKNMQNRRHWLGSLFLVMGFNIWP